MIEVFRTNITNHEIASEIVSELQCRFPLSLVNFDLEDCDRILRIKGDGIKPQGIIDLLGGKGYLCEALE